MAKMSLKQAISKAYEKYAILQEEQAKIEQGDGWVAVIPAGYTSTKWFLEKNEILRMYYIAKFLSKYAGSIANIDYARGLPFRRNGKVYELRYN